MGYASTLYIIQLPLYSLVATVIPVMFIFHDIERSFDLKLITPSGVVFTVGTSLSSSSFALYFSFCANELLFASNTNEAISTTITKISKDMYLLLTRLQLFYL